MKLNSSLLRVSVGSIALLACNCSTVREGRYDGSTQNLPANTIVIRNHTPFYLSLLRDGIPWRQGQEGIRTGESNQPLSILPHQDFTIAACASKGLEHIVLGLEAVKPAGGGCLPYQTRVGVHNIPLDLGTNAPAQIVTVRRWSF